MLHLPFVSCLCPTFHRPKLLANALACYLAQDWPADRRELIILDDGNDFETADLPDNVRIISTTERFASLPEKFNAAAGMTRPESRVFFVWEDDDIYLPHHISTHLRAKVAMQADYSKASRVLSTYPGHVVTEGAEGRFHAEIAFNRDLFERVGGWPLTKRADFDQQFLSRLQKACYGRADTANFGPPSYCFRYGSTHAYHGQHFMQSPDDEGWYDRVPRQPGKRDQILTPAFDDETKAVYAAYAINQGVAT